MNTSNSRPAYSRVYNITSAGSRLAHYLDYLNSRPLLQDLAFADLPVPEDPTEAVKRWIIANRDKVSMVVANAYIDASRHNWNQAVRWIFEYIWHDKMQRHGLDASAISKADWGKITVWITYQTDALLAVQDLAFADLAAPEQPDCKITPDMFFWRSSRPADPHDKPQPDTFNDTEFPEEFPDDFYETGLEHQPDEPVDDDYLYGDHSPAEDPEDDDGDD